MQTSGQLLKPKVEIGKACPCGFKYNEDVSHCESYTVNIHQYQPNNNSRDGSQLQEDGLVRVSAFKMRQKPSDTVHFVTVDLLNAYIGSLYRGQTEDSFIQGLNESRGKPRPIPRMCSVLQRVSSSMQYHMIVRKASVVTSVQHFCSQAKGRRNSLILRHISCKSYTHTCTCTHTHKHWQHTLMIHTIVK